MRASPLPFLAVAMLAAACGDQPASPTTTPPATTPAAPTTAVVPADAPAVAPADAPAAAKLDEKRYDHFGAGIAASTKPTDLADVLKSPDQFTGKTVAISAPIHKVCPTKGCWMKLGAPEPAMHVTFKDYAFFVPKDAGGRTAIVEGVLTKSDDTLAFKASGVAIAKAPVK